jgi:hypothetical protein
VSAASPVTLVDADDEADDEAEPDDDVPEDDVPDEDDDPPALVPLDVVPVEPPIGATADDPAVAEACDEVDVW